MGYLSQVSYVISDATKSGKLKDYVAYLLLIDENKLAVNNIKVSKDYNLLYFSEESAKWDGFYEDVILHEKIIKFDFEDFFLKKEKYLFVSLFIRLGEEIDDSDINTNDTSRYLETDNAFNNEIINSEIPKLSEYLYFQRSITINFNEDDFVNI